MPAPLYLEVTFDLAGAARPGSLSAAPLFALGYLNALFRNNDFLAGKFTGYPEMDRVYLFRGLHFRLHSHRAEATRLQATIEMTPVQDIPPDTPLKRLAELVVEALNDSFLPDPARRSVTARLEAPGRVTAAYDFTEKCHSWRAS